MSVKTLAMAALLGAASLVAAAPAVAFEHDGYENDWLHERDYAYRYYNPYAGWMTEREHVLYHQTTRTYGGCGQVAYPCGCYRVRIPKCELGRWRPPNGWPSPAPGLGFNYRVPGWGYGGYPYANPYVGQPPYGYGWYR